ncbi:MAG: hypothetical protein RR651_09140 [Lysinibacillus sp.]
MRDKVGVEHDKGDFQRDKLRFEQDKILSCQKNMAAIFCTSHFKFWRKENNNYAEFYAKDRKGYFVVGAHLMLCIEVIHTSLKIHKYSNIIMFIKRT